MKKIILKSIIKCPQCGFEKEETMPVNACQVLYQCTRCKAFLQAKYPQCCIFCSYGSVRCPLKQKEDLK